MCCLRSHTMARKDSRVDGTDRPSSPHLGQGWAILFTAAQLQLHSIRPPSSCTQWLLCCIKYEVAAAWSSGITFPFPLSCRNFWIHETKNVTLKRFFSREWRETHFQRDFLSVINLHAKSPVYRARIYIPIKYFIYSFLFLHEHGINTIISSFTKKGAIMQQ